jgi:hypothetical protein
MITSMPSIAAVLTARGGIMSDFTLQAPKPLHPARLECDVCYREIEPALIEYPHATAGFVGTGGTPVYHAFCPDCVEREGLVVGDSVSTARRDQMARVYEDLVYAQRYVWPSRSGR